MATDAPHHAGTARRAKSTACCSTPTRSTRPRARRSRTSPTPRRRAGSPRPRRRCARSRSWSTSSTRRPRRTSRTRRSRARSGSSTRTSARRTRTRASVPAVFKPLHADSKIQFKLATKDIFGASTTGITRTKTTKSSFSFNDAVKSSRQGRRRPVAGPALPEHLGLQPRRRPARLRAVPGRPGRDRRRRDPQHRVRRHGHGDRSVRPRPHDHPRGRPLAQPVPHLGRRRDRLQRLGQLRRHAQPGERELRQADVPAHLVQERPERRPVHGLHGLHRRRRDVHVHRRARRRA